jgi:lipopolysaccharide transport system ATP-binding protein
MTNAAVHVDGLAKQYTVGLRSRHHDTLRDHIVDTVASMFRRRRHRSTTEDDGSSGSFWALKDVSFDIQTGEVVGIIGRNGAGKSTLLKILSRVTEPTAGRATMRGRVGALLEVGTGFHPELTGRENIYLNGAIIGMKKTEITRKFDEIVDFSGVEKFIDTPVKRYSSGMHVRLAFAVAAHLDPEIMIVDEVLAVGDAAFQQKCLGKIKDVSSEGRTILFVSHSMPAVQALCTRCMLMDAGRITADGLPKDVTARYLMGMAGEMFDERVIDLWSHPRRQHKMVPALKRMWMTDSQGEIVTSAPMGAAVTFHVEYETDGSVQQPIVGLTFETATGEICGTNNLFGAGAKIIDGPTAGVFSFHVDRLPLTAGEYFISVAFAKYIDRNADRIARAFKLTVLAADVYGTGLVPEIGNCIIDGRWEFRAADDAAADLQTRAHAESCP